MTNLISLLLAIVSYTSPVNYQVTLAGNFGEPRPNHFHGGIDIKTDRREGKMIHAIGDGYVSRIIVNRGGFGKAIYIRHPEGYTSLYAHLKEFTPAIEALVRKVQYERKSFEVDFAVDATRLPVAQGQLVAISGNTGASQAPHLHLEIHDNDTGNMLDPLEFLGHAITDGIPPKANSLMVCPVAGKGTVNGDSRKRFFPFGGAKALPRQITAWGQIGFAIWADDLMERGEGNRYGVRRSQLFVDGVEVYRSDVNDIPLNRNRMVNVWGDYDYFLHTRIWFLRSYRLPGNRLPFITTGNRNGVVNIDRERDYHCRYVLSDYFGNTAEYTFVVTGKRTGIHPFMPEHDARLISWRRAHLLVNNGAMLQIPQGALADDVYVRLSGRPSSAGLSSSYTFGTSVQPLLKAATLSIPFRKDIRDPRKLLVRSSDPRKPWLRGTCRNGRIYADVHELGHTYTLGCDETAPSLEFRGIHVTPASHTVRVTAADNLTGIASLHAYLDGRFILLQPKGNTLDYTCRLEDTPVRPLGRLRRLHIVATDGVGNRREVAADITY